MSEIDAEVQRPALRVVKGEPSAEDVAVLAALLAAGGGEDAKDSGALRGAWRDPARTFRRMPIPGPNAWRSSGW